MSSKKALEAEVAEAMRELEQCDWFDELELVRCAATHCVRTSGAFSR